MTAPTTTTSTEERALTLLGSGIPAESVAAACGVTPSRIAQLLSDENFAKRVADLKFQALSKHNERDTTYDQLEDKVLVHLEKALPLIACKPMELVKTLSILNSAKRRGSSAPEAVTAQNTVVNLIMPIAITQKFTTNINNQVVNAGNQTLETIQSSALAARFSQAPASAPALGAPSNGHVIENFQSSETAKS